MSIEIKNISKRFGNFVAVNDVSLEVPNGSSSKSTFGRAARARARATRCRWPPESCEG